MNEPLLTVKDHFLIEGVGLVIGPQLEAPDKGFSNFNEKAKVSAPDGAFKELEISFRVEHFLMKDGRGEWKIAPVFPNAAKTDVPIGSVVEVSKEVLDRLNSNVQPTPRSNVVNSVRSG